MSQGKNVEASIQLFQFDHLYILVFCVHENQPVPLKGFTFKGTVYLTVTVLSGHCLKCCSHGVMLTPMAVGGSNSCVH